MSKQRRRRPQTLPDDELDVILSDILLDIAGILLSAGYGYARVSELTKKSFVRAAQTIAVEYGSKVNIARIAAVTGLTRIEVSKLSRRAPDTSAKVKQPTNRVGRVVLGWTTDVAYLSKDGSPRTLTIDGKYPSFSTLVKKFSGDIPPRAMLDEMFRLGMIQRKKPELVSLRRTTSIRSSNTVGALRAVVPWISFLADASILRSKDELTSRTDNLRIGFSSLPQVAAAMRELVSRHQAFVQSLSSLGSHSSIPHKFSLEVSVAVAATNPKKSDAGTAIKQVKGLRRTKR
jgi:hypothetical protein